MILSQQTHHMYPSLFYHLPPHPPKVGRYHNPPLPPIWQLPKLTWPCTSAKFLWLQPGIIPGVCQSRWYNRPSTLYTLPIVDGDFPTTTKNDTTNNRMWKLDSPCRSILDISQPNSWKTTTISTGEGIFLFQIIHWIQHPKINFWKRFEKQ